jgi:hypothetical protein
MRRAMLSRGVPGVPPCLPLRLRAQELFARLSLCLVPSPRKLFSGNIFFAVHSIWVIFWTTTRIGRFQFIGSLSLHDFKYFIS